MWSMREYRFNASPIYMLTSKGVSVPLKSDVYVHRTTTGSSLLVNPAAPCWRTRLSLSLSLSVSSPSPLGRSPTDLRAPCKLLSRFLPVVFRGLFSSSVLPLFFFFFFFLFVALLFFTFGSFSSLLSSFFAPPFLSPSPRERRMERWKRRRKRLVAGARLRLLASRNFYSINLLDDGWLEKRGTTE